MHGSYRLLEGLPVPLITPHALCDGEAKRGEEIVSGQSLAQLDAYIEVHTGERAGS